MMGLSEEGITSVEDVMKQIEMGGKCHMSGKTSANTQSSQIQAIFQTILKKRENFVCQVFPN